MRIIQPIWEDYQRKLIPADAPLVQIQETRRAFYAGARGLLRAIEDILSPGHDPTNADVNMLQSVYLELEAFAKSVEAGKN